MYTTAGLTLEVRVESEHKMIPSTDKREAKYHLRLTFSKTPPPNAASACVRQALCISQLTKMGELSGVHNPLAFRMLAAVKSYFFFMKVLLVNIKHITMPSLSHRDPRPL